MDKQEKQLTKQHIIETFKNLLKAENWSLEKEKVRELKEQFKALNIEEEKQQRATFKAEDEQDNFKFVKNELDHRFIELNNIYKEKLKAHKVKIALQEKQNLEGKITLIERLKILVESESGLQNVGEAFKEFYEIQDTWHDIGQVNKSNFKQIQYDYSHYRDLFYHNIHIYHQLKDYDFKKNGEQKQAIVEELKELADQDSLKKMEREVKDLQNKWDSIGPTSNEQWESLKNDYWNTVNVIYEKIRDYYKAKKEVQAEILNEKKGLIEQSKKLYEKTGKLELPSEWADITDSINELHKKWKAAGFAGKTQEDKIWEEFKGITDDIRLKTNDFFENLKEKNRIAEKAKKELIEKAESLKVSTDWKNTSKALIDLQKRWKTTGKAQYKVDQKLWERFRAACDYFFNAKQAFFNTMDDRQAENLKRKNDITTKIAVSKTEEELKQLIGEWQEVGFVPKKEISKAETNFDIAINKVAKTLKLEINNLNKLKFRAKIKAIKEDNNSEVKLRSEKQFIQNQIETLKEEIIRFEENMAYFGPSKGAQKLKEIVEKRKQEAELKLQDWQEKLKML